MTFAQVPGNADVKRALVAMADAGRVPHAILLHEEDGGGAFPLAIAFLQYLYCRQRRSFSLSCADAVWLSILI